MLLCLSRYGCLYNVDATDAHSEDGAARHKKSRRLTLKGKNSEPSNNNEVKNEDVMVMVAKSSAKTDRAKKKKIKKMNRLQTQRARIHLKRAQLKLKQQYVSSHDRGSSPPMEPPPPPPMKEGDQYYGSPPNKGPPPPPPMKGGAPMMGPHLPKWVNWHSDGWSNNNNYEHQGWKPDGWKPPHVPPPRHPYPPYVPPTPTTSDKPTYFPTYSSTSHPTYKQPESKYTRETVRITIQGLMNTYGIEFPTSREEYDALVQVLQRTIYETARASLYMNQKVTEVNIIEIEGITPQEETTNNFFHRLLQSANGNDSFKAETGSAQCTFQKRQQCCSRNLPGAGNPAQYCESLGCNFNTCRRIRFDIVAEQQLEKQGQSVTDSYTQRIVENLYNTITQYMTEQVDSGDFTISLRENANDCGEVCRNTLADATVTDVDFRPATDILIAIPTLKPTNFPTRDPVNRPTRPPTPTYQPTEGEPTLSPTGVPTTSPTLFVRS